MLISIYFQTNYKFLVKSKLLYKEMMELPNFQNYFNNLRLTYLLIFLIIAKN